jgi:hypothetical protein
MRTFLPLLLSCTCQLATSYSLVDTYDASTWQLMMSLETVKRIVLTVEKRQEADSTHRA